MRFVVAVVVVCIRASIPLRMEVIDGSILYMVFCVYVPSSIIEIRIHQRHWLHQKSISRCRFEAVDKLNLANE